MSAGTTRTATVGALALAIAALLVGPAATGAPARAPKPPGHAGRWITDAQGRVLILHGLNLVSKRPPYTPDAVGFGDDDAQFLADNGFTVVRLGVIYKAVEPRPGAYDDRYLDAIARTEATLARRGIVALIDFHQDLYNERFAGEGFPDWAVQDDGLPTQPSFGFPANYFAMPAVSRAFDHFWADDAGPGNVSLQQRYAAAWAHVAKRFAHDPNVIGYDVFNEPWPGSGWATCLAPTGCPASDAQLGAFETRVIAAIRRVDRDHLVWYEPNVLFNFGIDTQLADFADNRVGMSFHDYCLAGVVKPGECASAERKVLTNADRRAATTHDALLMTEFGATNDAGDLTRLVTEVDEHQGSWIEWSYCACDDPTGSIPPSTEALVVDMHRAPTGDNVDHTKLEALARPVPRAIAGTPRTFAFDPGTKRFTLTYTTRRADGHGRFPADACTSVLIPRVQYPQGYQVDATGARVVSSRSAGTLELRARKGADQVTVTVTPTSGGRTDRPRASAACTGRH